MSITKNSSKIRKLTLYNIAINNVNYGRKWKEIIEKESQNLKNYLIWEYNKLLPGQKMIRLKQVFKVKYHSNGSIARFKARLIAQRFSQVQGINFLETFASTVRKESLHIYLALYLMLNLFIYLVDIVDVYLESLVNNNKLSIFIKLSLEMHNFY